MRQALHIFTKDVRRLRWEILPMLALVAVFASSEPRPDPNDVKSADIIALLLPFAWTYLIARVIHAEALPGHKQFWLTRPYSWKSLLAAKALFVLAFVTLPMMIADAVIVTMQGFQIAAHLDALIWEQMLWWLVIVIPVAALAAVTSGLVGFVSWLLAICAIYLGVFSQRFDQRPRPEWWQWIHFSLAILACFAVIVVWQYARRRTEVAQVAIACVLALEVLILFLPPGVGFFVQAALSKTSGGFRITFDPSRTTLVHDNQGGARVALSLRMDDVPQGLQIREDGAVASIESAAGRTLWRSGDRLLVDWSFDQEPGAVLQFLYLDGALFDQLKDQPVRIKTSALFTLYGNQRTVTLPTTGQVEVPGVGICDMETSLCRFPFRGPRVWDSTSRVAPSPHPAELTLRPIIIFGLRDLYPSGVLTTEEPVMRLKSDFEIGPIRLGSLER
jgi:hypothetical protein